MQCYICHVRDTFRAKTNVLTPKKGAATMAVVIDQNGYEVNAGEFLGSDSEWTVLAENVSVTVHGGGTAKNITLSQNAFLTVEYDNINHLYGIVDGLDLTEGMLNVSGGKACNVK